MAADTEFMKILPYEQKMSSSSLAAAVCKCPPISSGNQDFAPDASVQIFLSFPCEK